ncbi:MAG: hypothetical protein JWR48_1425, partial [Mycobacterium sp.]|nr:hypothetical protein [Mycobacterium sp.]
REGGRGVDEVPEALLTKTGSAAGDAIEDPFKPKFPLLC